MFTIPLAVAVLAAATIVPPETAALLAEFTLLCGLAEAGIWYAARWIKKDEAQ